MVLDFNLDENVPTKYTIYVATYNSVRFTSGPSLCSSRILLMHLNPLSTQCHVIFDPAFEECINSLPPSLITLSTGYAVKNYKIAQKSNLDCM